MKTRTHTFTGRISKATHQRFENCLEQQRQLWNAALHERKDAWRKEGKSITLYDQYKSLTVIRADDADFDQYSARAQRTILNHLDKAYKAFFRRVKAGEKPGHPRFRGRNRKVRSIELPCPRIHTTEKGIHSFTVKGLGRFRFKGELPEGEYKMLRIVKTPRRIKVQLVVESETQIVKDDRPSIGIDVGVKAQVTLSNGHREPKNIVDKTELKRRQKIRSRAQPGSNSREKKKQAVARESQRVREQEHGKTHELTSGIIKNHSANIYVEKIKPSNLTRKGGSKKKGPNRAILEQQWGKIKQQLAYKAGALSPGEREGRSPSHGTGAGGFVEEVDPRNTSQACSSCGGMPPEKLGLDARWYVCGHCGHEADRDVNAAKNIRQKGLNETPKPGGNPPARGADAVVTYTSKEMGGLPTTRKDVRKCFGT